MRFIRTICQVVVGLLLYGLTAQAAIQLPKGRYIGYVQPDGSDRRVALTLDTLVEQPNDLTQFPQLNALVKVSLGGPKGNEYTSEHYENVLYDFTNGVLTLSAAGNDVSMTLNVKNEPVTTLNGRAFIRSAGLSGSVHLDYYDPDNIDNPSGVDLPVNQDAPLLAGSYRGLCGATPVVLQLETGRGLAEEGTATAGLVGYRIAGRLAAHDPDVCAEAPLCALRSYHAGSFNLYSGRLVLDAPNSQDDCELSQHNATCHIHLGADTWTCELTRDATPIAAASYTTNPYPMAPSTAQMTKLPPPAPPANMALINALAGDFNGYLYNESTDHFQRMRLSVLAASSTNNPHNENLVYVTGATVLYTGQSGTDELFVQPFEPRSFYLAPGFTLESPNADAFLQVTDWRAGYLSGVWFSHAFGRVGTFELVKSASVPPLPKSAKFVPSLAGRYMGPFGQRPAPSALWRFDLSIPNQPAPTQAINTLSLTGNYTMVDPETREAITPMLLFERGAYDFNTLSLGLLTHEATYSENRLVAGHVADDGNLHLLWPNAPHAGLVVQPDHDDEVYVPWH